MDVEKLTKSQLILLTLLVSFVSSIATGIVTVSLMEQAPPAIAQTVNRVVERTIEHVVPAASQAATAVVTTEKTIVVKESDLISKAVAAVTPSVVRLVREDTMAIDGKKVDTFLGFGIVTDSSGTIVTDAIPAKETGGAIAILADGTRAWAALVEADAKNGFLTLKGATSTEAGPIGWKPITISNTDAQLGESVVVISGKSSTRIASGIATAVTPGNIDTDIPSDSVLVGSPLINVDGELIGISTAASRDTSGNSFLPASFLIPHSGSNAQDAGSGKKK